jgi:hypothetical protein
LIFTAAVVGTICGGLEDLKSKYGKVFGLVFGAGALLFTAFGGFIAYQTTTLRFTFSDDSFALVKADGQSIGEVCYASSVYNMHVCNMILGDFSL